MTSPLLWYLNRGTGIVLLVLMTLTTVLGVLATARAFHPSWPRFVTQSLHRALAGTSVLLLTVHVVSAVVDEFVDIRWWQAVIPWGATYKPLYLSLGTLALDVIALVVVSSLLRASLPEKLWRTVHVMSYAAWGLSVVHGLGIGTDASLPWFVLLTWGCVASVGLAAVTRAVGVGRGLVGSSA